jgi:hypothetical protein
VNKMQMYKVIVNVGTIEENGISIDMVYTDIYANSAKDAVNSIVVQKKVNIDDIVSVQSDAVY